MAPELPKRYDPKEAEKRWQAFWKERDCYRFSPKKGQRFYTIDTPPPTVSGKMHIGHAFSYAQGDFIARYRRMRGEAVFYPFGTDDNGLPTEKLVEREKKVNSKRMERKAFRDLCLATVNEQKPAFVRPWQDLGISADFAHSYSTIDRHSQRVSQRSFIDLYGKGLVYRKETPTTWCPSCQTAIAQAEFDNIDLASTFNDITFMVGGKPLTISTTRPELLPACVAVFVHPDDVRYKDLVGKTARTPLFDVEVPIIADEKADPGKGSGAVMCCTFGDKTDIEWWYKYRLPLRMALTRDGRLSDLAGEFAGQPLREARKSIIAAMKEKGLLTGQRPITHAVNVHERCQTEVEFLNTTQWFIDVLGKKDELVALADQIAWYPSHMKVRYVHWVENLSWDWCISRQRHYGVPFPVWYCKACGKPKLAEMEDLPVDPLVDSPKGACACGSADFDPETDVMDTWATSSLTPQIALGWGSKGFEERFPMALRMQAHDIIRTWAFYTIVKAYYHEGTVPWKEIMISGHALDPHGKKMSKSKGNTVDPLATLERYNADALRYWAAGSKLGDDLPFLEKELVTGNRTITKLFNAGKFTIMHLQDYAPEAFGPGKLEATDRWLLSRFSSVVEEVTASLDQYEYFKAKSITDDFFWHVFCDNYLEIVKGRLYNAASPYDQGRRSAQHALYTVLLGILKLFAPIMPHITEELYQMHFAKTEKAESVHLSSWPAPLDVDADAVRAGDLAVEILSEIRKYKSGNSLSLGAGLAGVTVSLGDGEPDLSGFAYDLQGAAKAQAFTFGKVEGPAISAPRFRVGIRR